MSVLSKDTTSLYKQTCGPLVLLFHFPKTRKSIMISITYSVTISILSFILWFVYIAIWRLYFSPIAQFPGPRLAALTQWYEVYYDLFKGGQFIFKLLELHEQYGIVILISLFLFLRSI
jgi:hypothetical protein